MSARGVRRLRTVSVGDRTQVEGHRVLAGGAWDVSSGMVPAESTSDPLVTALAQLVRDRWAAERGDGEKLVASARVPSNMVTMVRQRSNVDRTSA